MARQNSTRWRIRVPTSNSMPAVRGMRVVQPTGSHSHPRAVRRVPTWLSRAVRRKVWASNSATNMPSLIQTSWTCLQTGQPSKWTFTRTWRRTNYTSILLLVWKNGWRQRSLMPAQERIMRHISTPCVPCRMNPQMPATVQCFWRWKKQVISSYSTPYLYIKRAGISVMCQTTTRRMARWNCWTRPRKEKVSPSCSWATDSWMRR